VHQPRAPLERDCQHAQGRAVPVHDRHIGWCVLLGCLYPYSLCSFPFNRPALPCLALDAIPVPVPVPAPAPGRGPCPCPCSCSSLGAILPHHHPTDQRIVHDHKYVAEQLEEALETMGPRTVVSIITDSAPVMAAAGELVRLKCVGFVPAACTVPAQHPCKPRCGAPTSHSTSAAPAAPPPFYPLLQIFPPVSSPLAPTPTQVRPHHVGAVRNPRHQLASQGHRGPATHREAHHDSPRRRQVHHHPHPQLEPHEEARREGLQEGLVKAGCELLCRCILGTAMEAH